MKVYWKKNEWGCKDEYQWTMVTKEPVGDVSEGKDLSLCLPPRGRASPASLQSRVSIQSVSVVQTFPFEFTKNRWNELLVYKLVCAEPVLVERLPKIEILLGVLCKNTYSLNSSAYSIT